ncbi:MAG: DUF2231 domain-containing protein [Solirubrobacteraceae bacterium]
MSSRPRPFLLDLTERLERISLLDGPANALVGRVRAAIPEGPVRQTLRGDALGHALHPLLTDLPIGTWTSSIVLDFLGGKSSRRAADTLIAVGILSYLPAAASGASDWSERTEPGPARRVGLVHAAANLGALGLFTSSLLHRARGRRARGRVLSLAGAAALGLGGYLGGHLSLVRAVGVEADPTQSTAPASSAEPPYAPPLH